MAGISSRGSKEPIEGFLVIDKPSGVSSYDVIRVIKRHLRLKKIGHTGTLDPLASGVLPVAINRGTKVVPFLDERVKEYEGTMRLGIVTDSDDSTGRVLQEIRLDGEEPTREQVQTIFSRFLGKIKQVPPMFSAAKYHGRPLYVLARRGIRVERREREVEVFGLDMTGIEPPFVHFRISCSRGTYVRTLCRQIGEALGVGAHLCRLRRTRSGPFSLGQSVTLEGFVEAVDAGEIGRRVISLREALGDMPEIEIGGDLGDRIRKGRQVLRKDLQDLGLPRLEGKQRIKILHGGEIVAIAEAQTDGGGEGSRPALSLLRVFS